MKRRDFIRRAAIASAAPIIFKGLSLKAFARPDGASALRDTDRVLVIIQFEGGNDGLNTLIPVEDDLYYNARPNLMLPKGDALALDGEAMMRLHPSMSGMQSMFNDGLLAAVQNVGYERSTMSHFTGTEIWNTASGSLPKDIQTTGWVGRYLHREFPDYPDVLPDDPPAIEISPATSSIFTVVGASIGMSLTDPAEFYDLVNGGPNVDREIAPDTLSGREWNYIDAINRQSQSFSQSIKTAADRSANRVVYPSDNSLAAALAIVARLVAGGLKTRVYKVSLGGFDTHFGQLAQQAKLLGIVSSAVKAFQDDLLALGVADRVVGMTYSEFGRRIKDNSTGTDHGTAAPHFVFGSAINGGRTYGGNPDLANPDANGNLVYTVGFPCYYASVIAPLFSLDDSSLAEILPVSLCDRPSFVPLYRTQGVKSETAIKAKKIDLR